MTRFVDALFKVFEAMMVACLVAMVAMVFGNAVLRKLSDYGILLFGGGFETSEEMSRIVFVWLTFIGAVVVARDGSHLGVEAFVARFGARGRTVLMVVSDMLVILCCAVFFWGTWRQAPLHVSNHAPITGISMIWVYGLGFFASAGMATVAAVRIARALAGRVTPDELRRFAGEYDEDIVNTPKGQLE